MKFEINWSEVYPVYYLKTVESRNANIVELEESFYDEFLDIEDKYNAMQEKLEDIYKNSLKDKGEDDE